MNRTRPRPRRAPARAAAVALALSAGLLAVPGRAAPPAPAPRAAADPFARFDLPDDWEARYWASADAKALFALPPAAAADLVPTQAGVRFCRCPACDAPESDDPLTWSVAHPSVLTCRRCGVVVPDDKYPARDEKKGVPEETVEVLPGVVHKYPYHEVEPARQRFPGERLYLAARRDDAAREALAKAVLYAAVRYHEQPRGRKDPAVAHTAAVLLLRFAQVYPAYATHHDQPGSPKYFESADPPPPYRRAYGTGKWCWTGSLDVPLNLVVAYALLRDDPALGAAGTLLGVADPARAIEHDLFRASARFVRRQPEEFGAASLQADRGILAVGRLLNDPALVHDALARLERFAERGFAHDGFWGEGSLEAHRRVLAQLDGWIDRLLDGYSDPPGPVAGGGRRLDAVTGLGAVPALTLARAAGSAALADTRPPDVQPVSWPAPAPRVAPRAPALLGGTGLARLAVGDGPDALDVEVRGLAVPGPDRIRRQALRLAVGGRTALGDLDDAPPTPGGFERASASRNTVLVNGLNQRESPALAAERIPSGNVLFFAADPDFQAVTLDDPRSYPQSCSRYRQTVVVSAGPRARYALGVFEVHGGSRHDQLFHGPAGATTRWQVSEPTAPGPETLLSPGVTFVPSARADDGRWFVQALGEFAPQARAELAGPAQASLVLPGGAATGVRLHLLGDTPTTALTATSPDPTGGPGRGSLVLHRRSAAGMALSTTFVTLFEPIARAIPPLGRVVRAGATREAVVVSVETVDGPEHLAVNLSPGSTVTARLADGRVLVTDGLAVKVTATGLVLAGGTYAECTGLAARQRPAGGRVAAAVRQPGGEGLGWFESDTPLPDPESLAGRALLIRHGDGTTRGWTLLRVENTARGARLYVCEQTGFRLEGPTGPATYDLDPRKSFPAPHDFRISRVARGVKTRP